MNDTEERVNAFVGEILDGYIPAQTGEKTVHDPIWGSVLYSDWEIRLIDSPIVQRLRNIGQLGMAELTYTAARHSRFEHSLGTAAIAGRMMTQLKMRSNVYVITERLVNMVRLAAILHDVGHCFFSHLSERVYGEMEEFKTLMSEKGINASPHEFMSYLIITSDSFITFFDRYVGFPDNHDSRALLFDVAALIVGNTVRDAGGTILSFMTSVINGEFDADKLDYTQRDSYTAGIAMTYGADRFLMKLILYRQIGTDGTADIKLAVSTDALTNVEELIFNRNVLFVTMYRHQKVLATESALRDVILGMKDLGLLRSPADFLRYTDSDIENFDDVKSVPFATENVLTLGQMIRNIRLRRLPKRVAEYSLEKLRVDEDDEKDTLLLETYINKINGDPTAVRERIYELIRDEYYSRGKIVDFNIFDIYVNFPSIIKNNTAFLLVSKENGVRSTADIKYISRWASAFAAEKWRGYIFCSANVDRDTAADALRGAELF